MSLVPLAPFLGSARNDRGLNQRAHLFVAVVVDRGRDQ
jgi:hypothetical protein